MRSVTLNSKTVTEQLNRCYLDWHPGYPNNVGVEYINAFKYYIERTAGLRIYFVEELDKTGRYGFRLDNIEVIDEKKYMLFQIRYV